MSAVAAPVITCPSWCTISPEEHAADYDRRGITCHFPEDREVDTSDQHRKTVRLVETYRHG